MSSSRATVLGLIVVLLWQFMAPMGGDPSPEATSDSQLRSSILLQEAHEHFGSSALVGLAAEATGHLAADDSSQVYGLVGGSEAATDPPCRSSCSNMLCRAAASSPAERLFRPPRATA